MYQNLSIMTRILVPVDFSKISLNAAEYAMGMAGALEKAEVILFHVYPPTGIGSDGSPVEVSDDKRRKDAAQMLEDLQVHLFNIAPVPTDFRYGDGEFLTGIRTLLAQEHFDLIVMGIAHASAVEERLLGSSVFNVIEENTIPVVIVGDGMTYKQMKRIALAVELSDVHQSVPFGRMKMFLDSFKPELHLVYATEEAGQPLTQNQEQEKQKLMDMFKDYAPKFTTLQMYDFVESLNTFVHQREIDLLVMMPRKLSLWQRFFGYSHTRKLAFHGIAPIVAMHD